MLVRNSRERELEDVLVVAEWNTNLIISSSVQYTKRL